MSDEVWDEDGNCVDCDGSGELDCLLCDRDDQDRYDCDGCCTDCGEPPGVIGVVQCDTCSGFGTLYNAVAAGCATYD